ncbi:phosphohydrolase [Lactiplantibacillus fabifermentans]|uniref:Phosphohydrolase n=2 Tax=Lactiplantibacillus fabifermentans TaxID=483011 RepID=A0A0R2NND1_9LACO|nr:phosphohydrolase [Lactiplantibacillus fabifermentans]ETY73475.1 phosphohydrolase [Lactiplantibacillus fabifermentans T30PCM01]KRO27222.1 hypothetical protein DY78_GL000193 [Lactiplantibacillus fabifermentans DSM 21115]
MIVEQINPLFVCGIIGDATSLVVNKSLTGPFANRYDLATAPVDTELTLGETVSRITKLQTGLETVIAKQLGTIRFTFPATYELSLQRAMISTFYLLEPVGGTLITKRPSYTSAFSAGAARVPLAQLNWANSSPLVMQAKRFLATGTFPIADQQIAAFQIPTAAQF